MNIKDLEKLHSEGTENIPSCERRTFLKAGLAILKPSREVQLMDGYREAVVKLLQEPQFHEQAAMFAKKYKDFEPEKQISEIVDRCEAIMRNT